jgi:hypothetical protein
MMSEFNDFFKLIAEGKQDYKENDPVGKRLEEVKHNIKGDLSLLFGQIGEAKVNDPVNKRIETVKEHVKTDLNSLFAQLSEIVSNQEPAEAEQVETILDEIIEELPIVEDSPIPPKTEQDSIKAYADYFKDASFQQPDVPIIDPTIKAVQDKLKFLEQWMGKISATGPGGGEVNLRWLDDVYRPSISDGRFLRYNDTLKKFEFAEVNPHDIVYTTILITTPTYTVSDEDYYMGVNYAGPVTITLPITPSSGRMLIIKDESGNASSNPITVLGTVDNDTGGFIIQLDNGAIQMIYRNGWRIV